MKFIIKVSPEIIIKSKPVRKRTIRLLAKNIKVFLSNYLEEIDVHDTWDRIDINMPKNYDETKKKEIIKIMSFIPGIYNFYEVIEKNFINLDDTFDNIKDVFLDKIRDKSFVVRIHRTGSHSFNSMEAERYIGGLFLKNATNAKVNLKNPDETINIDIKSDKYFIIKDKYNGIGGYPVSFQGKVLSLISGGFDSGVSTYMSMKRGCEVDFLFFNLGGKAHELGVKQVASYLWKNFSPNYKARFTTINFEEVVKEILTKINHKYRGIILKRFMLKCACEVGKRVHLALVKGDSLGQVSSQTLSNMAVIDKASSMLVLRPLITYDKLDIINISKMIGTYNFACNMPEYCGVISDRPATKSEESEILEEEKNIDEICLKKAVETRKVEKMIDLLKEDLGELETSLDVVYLPGKDEIVIDLRDEEKIEKNPLTLSGVNILNIPFYDINSRFPSLDHSKTYLFYCERGVLSKLHTLYLKEKGFQNIKVLRYDNNKIKCKK